MNSEPKKLIFNPVLAAPWKAQRKFSGNPTVFRLSQPTTEMKRVPERPNQIPNNFHPLAVRQQNIQSLLLRFPGLKKYQAKAALTISNNQLEKAIVLLEVSNCYRKEVVAKKASEKAEIGYLKKVQINLHYNVEEQDPTLRNIVFETFFRSRGNESESSHSSSGERGFSTDSESKQSNSRSTRVGVVIFKTPEGYRATLL